MITSIHNSAIKNVIALQKKGKIRKEQNTFVVEGIKMFSELPKERHIITYVSEGFLSEENREALLEHIHYEVVSDKVFQEMSDTKTPQGILSLVKQVHYQLSDLLMGTQPVHFMILEDIQDPGNLGTIFRTAEGAGVTGIIMTKGTVDIYNPKVIRSTMGSVYRIPFLYTENSIEIIYQIKKNAVLYAAHLQADHSYYEEDYRESCAFLIGNEANGLREETAKLADHWISIPMEGRVESLNAAVAASILMYEVHRQRKK